jgi:heme-degrading monooxygenase HmoA
MVFHYEVSPHTAPAFERTYGSDGDWARFFASDPAYRGSELWRSLDHPAQYVVVDRWDSRAAYDAFRRERSAEYDERSAACARLYASERVAGSFQRA